MRFSFFEEWSKTEAQYIGLQLFRMWDLEIHCQMNSSAPDFTDRNSGEKGVNHFWDSYLLRKTPVLFWAQLVDEFLAARRPKPLYIFGFAHH